MLTNEEKEFRMQDWRNIKVLYERAKARRLVLKTENRELKTEIETLKEKVAKLEAENMEMKARIAELQEWVFKRKKHKKDDNDKSPPSSSGREGKSREAASYRREVPKQEEVTERKRWLLTEDFCTCGSSLEKSFTAFYEEEIPVIELKKQVTEHTVEKGYCKACRKHFSAKPIPGSPVILGQQVKLYIVFLSILSRLSFSQIRMLLEETWHLSVSDGEISNILTEMGERWRAPYEKLKRELQESEGIHLDETSWGKYWLWIMDSMKTETVLYQVASTRGKGIADKLIGTSFSGLRMNDGYGAYKNQPGKGCLCWGHPHRYLRTLKGTPGLTEETKIHCTEAYAEFEDIYASFTAFTKEPFSAEKRAVQKNGLVERLKNFTIVNLNDPKKLKNIRKQFAERSAEYLRPMDFEGVPLDNNKAERDLRHFVIKRKISFGSKTDKGAKAFETCASILMTYFRRYPKNLFASLLSLPTLHPQ